MSRRVSNTPFRELLPSSIASDAVLRACADALDGVFKKSLESLPDILIAARLAHDAAIADPVPMSPALARLADFAGGLPPLSREILDLLAWQFHVEAYDSALDDDARRKLIFSSVMLHRRRGTPWAVRQALMDALNMPAIIRQWFEYGGDPYFFRVRFDASSVYADPECLQAAFRVIMEYKNVRSWLEMLQSFQVCTLEISPATALVNRTASRQILYFAPPATPTLHIRADPAVIGKTSERQILLFHETPAPALSIRSDPAIQTKTASRQKIFFPATVPVCNKICGLGHKYWTYSRLRLAG